MVYHMLHIGHLPAPKPFCNIVKAPPKLIAGTNIFLLRRLFYKISRIVGFRDLGQDAVLVEQNFAQGIIKNPLLRVRDGFHMQVDPVPVCELHQPAVRFCRINSFIRKKLRKFVRALHIQDFSKHALRPVPVFYKAFGFTHNITHIIILKNIPGCIRVRPRTVYVDCADALVLLCYL